MLESLFQDLWWKPSCKFPLGFNYKGWESLVFVWSMVMAIWLSGPCKQPLTSSAPSRDRNRKTFKLFMDISCFTTFFDEIIFFVYSSTGKLLISYSLDSDWMIFFLRLFFFSKFLFFSCLGSRSEHRKLQSPSCMCLTTRRFVSFKRLKEKKKDSEEYKNSVSRQKRQQRSA